MGVVHIGIDPGTTGAFCVLTPAPMWGCDVCDLPVIVEPKMRKGKLGKAKKVDAAKLVALFRQIVPAGHAVVVTIEDVFTIPGMNTSSLSSDAMVAARMTCENACAMFGWKVQKVRPQTWQNFFGLKGADKKLSLGTAQRLYPAAGLRLAKEHNKAEAVLIAHYARRNHTEALAAP